MYARVRACTRMYACTRVYVGVCAHVCAHVCSYELFSMTKSCYRLL